MLLVYLRIRNMPACKKLNMPTSGSALCEGLFLAEIPPFPFLLLWRMPAKNVCNWTHHDKFLLLLECGVCAECFHHFEYSFHIFFPAMYIPILWCKTYGANSLVDTYLGTTSFWQPRIESCQCRQRRVVFRITYNTIYNGDSFLCCRTLIYTYKLPGIFLLHVLTG